MFIKSPKKEEQEVPDTIVTQFSNNKEAYANGEIDVMDEFEGILGIEDEENLSKDSMYSQLSWGFMDWEEHPKGEDGEGEYKVENRSNFFEEESYYSCKVIKKESLGLWDDDENKVPLNLNLNYQEVLDAWSDRGPLFADDCSLSLASNGYYVSIQQT